MFDIINQAMLEILKLLHAQLGSYALAIIAITILLRVLLWPLNSSQTRSMKKMQELQPKLKKLQDQHKDNPQKMQAAMMQFYQEHQFNPFAGCLPILVQIPIFIGLYGALSSPEFLALSGSEHFLFIDRLYHTMQSHGGEPMNGTFDIIKEDKFSTGKTAVITLKKNHQVIEQHIGDVNKVLTTRPTPLIPGSPITFDLSIQELGFSPDYETLIEKAEVPIINQGTREIENVSFTPAPGRLTASFPSAIGKNQFHQDTLILLIIYAIISFLYQQLMQRVSPPPAAADGNNSQAQMMKLMPLVFVVMIFFIPIPAGVMLYLVLTMVLMFIQTAWVFWSEHKKSSNKPDQRPDQQVVDIISKQ
ncbi:MAG: membrane protein insertase YidC [Cyanobacteria bacterium]|nr:membrane protein insertase YidC [Cyanobacteriota bacterium]